MDKFGVLKDASQIINIRDFLENWDASVIPGVEVNPLDPKIKTENAVMSTELELPMETVEELATVCGEDTLRCGQETTDIEMLQNFPEDVPLMTLRYRKQELERRKQDPSYRMNCLKFHKYRFHDEKLMNLSGARPRNKDRIPPEFLVQHPDVIITVIVMEGNLKQSAMNNIKVHIDQTFLVLGCEKLTDLRDKISCVNDLSVAGDFSTNPDAPGYYAKDIYKSGFFYIEGCFYNDMREPECRDYSQTITDWMSSIKKDKEQSQFEKKKMEDVTFLDLNIRLGQPYLYMHQGDCEHLLIFTDVRLLSKDEVQDIREYPRLIRKKRVRGTKCRVCQLHAARWVTNNSEHAPENPCFFCEQCFQALHYDENGHKLGNFEAYRFFDHSAVI